MTTPVRPQSFEYRYARDLIDRLTACTRKGRARPMTQALRSRYRLARADAIRAIAHGITVDGRLF